MAVKKKPATKTAKKLVTRRVKDVATEQVIVDWRDVREIFRGAYETFSAALEAAVKARVNLAYASLDNASLVGASLVGASLDNARLVGASLVGASLVGASLVGASLDNASLVGASLVGASLDNARLDNARLVGASLVGASLVGASLDNARLDNARLVGARLVGASLVGASLDNARLENASLVGATGINRYRSTSLLLLRDQPGAIVLYKLVTDKWTGNHYPDIIYRIGDVVTPECPADTDEMTACGSGINVADLPYCMKDWKPGWHILRVQFTAADIAAIPTCTDGKIRLHRCQVISEVDLVEIGLVEATKTEVIA